MTPRTASRVGLLAGPVQATPCPLCGGDHEAVAQPRTLPWSLLRLLHALAVHPVQTAARLTLWTLLEEPAQREALVMAHALGLVGVVSERRHHPLWALSDAGASQLAASLRDVERMGAR